MTQYPGGIFLDETVGESTEGIGVMLPLLQQDFGSHA